MLNLQIEDRTTYQIVSRWNPKLVSKTISRLRVGESVLIAPPRVGSRDFSIYQLATRCRAMAHTRLGAGCYRSEINHDVLGVKLTRVNDPFIGAGTGEYDIVREAAAVFLPESATISPPIPDVVADPVTSSESVSVSWTNDRIRLGVMPNVLLMLDRSLAQKVHDALGAALSATAAAA